MTSINLTLLLGLSLKKIASEKKADKKKKDKKDEKEKKGGEDKDTAKGKKGKKGKKQQKVEPEEEVVKPRNLFEVGSPKKSAHIEYELVPDRPPFKVDVNCWGEFARVYIEDNIRAIRTIVQNEIAWVPIKIKHFMKSMSTEELQQLQYHTIKFSIWARADKLEFPQAKAEHTTELFIHEENLDNGDVVEAFERMPEAEEQYRVYLKQEQKNMEQRLFQKCVFKGDPKNSYLAYLNYFPDEAHDYTIKKIIGDINDGAEINCKELVRVWNAASAQNLSDYKKSVQNVKVKEKGSKKEKKGKKKDGDAGKTGTGAALVISVSGELFFTEPNLTVHRVAKRDREVYDAYGVITVKNLMTRFQKSLLNPLVINVKKINNLPVKILAKHGFKNIIVRYNVPQIALCATSEKPISETVHMNESHVFFLRNTPESALYEFFNCKQFIVEIVGLRTSANPAKAKNSCLFGAETTDVKFSQRLEPLQCLDDPEDDDVTPVQLAVASYDLSTLLKCSWCFTMESQCRNPETCMSAKTSDPLLFTDIINAQELNLDCFKEIVPASCLTDDVLMDLATSVTLEMFLQAPQTRLLRCHTAPGIFQRMLIFTSDELLATNLLNQILLHNQKYMTPEVITPNYLKSGTKVMFDKDSSDVYFVTTTRDTKDVVTGFLLDNVTSYVFFVEGTPIGLITTLWRQVMNLPVTVAFTHFNSHQIFLQRFYEEFLPFGGFYIITLQTTLRNIMSQTHIYLRGNAPMPCWEALKRFDLLLRCKAFQYICQFNLLPSAKQLLSLDVEFGVPLRWRKPTGEPAGRANSKEEKET